MRLSDFITDVGQPLSYYPSIARLVGVKECVLLCQFIYWYGKQADPDGWIYKTREDIRDETGMSFREQETARNSLRSKKLLNDKYDRLNHQLFFRVNFETLNELWESAVSAPKAAPNPQTTKRVFGKTQNVKSGKHKTLFPENTDPHFVNKVTEITPETTPPPPTPSVPEAVEEVEEYIERETDRAAGAGEIRTTRQKYAAAVRRKITSEGGRLTPERREQLEQWRSPPTAPCTIPVFVPNAPNESIGEAKIQDHEIRARTLARLPPWEQELVRTREYLKEIYGE